MDREPLHGWSPGREKLGHQNSGIAGACILERHEGYERGDERVNASPCERVISRSTSARSAVWLGLGRRCVCQQAPRAALERVPNPGFILQPGGCFDDRLVKGN